MTSKETVNISNLNRLSNQEKYILELLSNGQKWESRYLSSLVAEHFDKDGSRIEKFQVKEYTDRASKTFYLQSNFEAITNKHSSSFSRSMKRLVKRGLVKKIKEQHYRYSASEITYYQKV